MIDEYHCILTYDDAYGNLYTFQNDVFELKIYIWEQFDDLEINLIYDSESFQINPYVEDLSLNKKIRGIKGFFFRYSEQFWTIIANIVKNKIIEIIK